MSISDMTLERAQQIFAEVAEWRLRFGKQYDGGPVGIHNILDAIVVIGKEGNKADAAIREQLTLSNRQLAASKAREAKYRKKLGLADTRNDADPDAGGA